MTYFEGFIVPVPEANKDAFAGHANQLSSSLRDCGVQRQLEAWGSDVPEGKVTDFRKAVDAKPGENVVFAWFEYPDRQARDRANEAMMSNSQMMDMSTDVPFDAKRMILGGFDAIVEAGKGPGGYINGFIVPVPSDKQDAYRTMVEGHAAIFREYGALRFVQAWGDDVPEGKVTDFRRAVKAEPNETIVFAFLEWPDKAASDEAWEKIMKNGRMQPSPDVPFDGKRMFWGGFEVVIDTAREQPTSASATPVTA